MMTAQPCTHLPFLFPQKRFPLTSYPSIGINMSFSISPLSYTDAISSPLGSPSTHTRHLIPLFSDLDMPKCRLQPQGIVRDCSFAEKMAEAPPAPQKKKCQVTAQSPVYKVSNNPKPIAMSKPKSKKATMMTAAAWLRWRATASSAHCHHCRHNCLLCPSPRKRRR